MRFPIPILCRATLAAILLCVSIAAAPGEDRSEADDRRDARLEWHSLANGRTEFDVSDPVLVPRRLALAADQSGCRYKEEIKDLPVRFISVEERRFAIVFCRMGVLGSHQIFDLADLQKPKLVELPIIAPNGFGTTPRPGAITWKRDVGVLEAETVTDVCPGIRFRHTYRPGFNQSWVSNFVIVRVEVLEGGCGEGKWDTVWEPPQWSKSVVGR
jgi:hypothetical protein